MNNFLFHSYFQRHLKYKVAISLDSKQYTLFCQQPLRVLCEIDSIVERKEAGGENEGAIATGETTVSNIPCFERTQSESAAGEDGDEDEEDYSTSADSQTLVRMLEDHEKVNIEKETKAEMNYNENNFNSRSPTCSVVPAFKAWTPLRVCCCSGRSSAT